MVVPVGAPAGPVPEIPFCEPHGPVGTELQVDPTVIVVEKKLSDFPEAVAVALT